MTTSNSSTVLDTHADYQAGVDLTPRIDAILAEIIDQTGFQVDDELWRSRYYGSERIGAIHFKGKWQNQAVVLKIQGAKPQISEFEMITQFRKQNRSQIIRPPHIYWHRPWNEDSQYEAFLLEHATGPKVLPSEQLHTEESVREFLAVYTEYRQNCIPREPWLPAPQPPDVTTTLHKGWQLSAERYPQDARRHPDDWQLVESATQSLASFYQDVPLQFLHGHFSVEDLLRQGNQIILFSNLYWKWKYPYYDAVFGYHWYMLTLQHVPNITAEQIERQRDIWMTELLALTEITDATQRRLLYGALLERAIAGLVLDSFLVQPTHPLAEHFTQTQREQIVLLLDKIKAD